MKNFLKILALFAPVVCNAAGKIMNSDVRSLTEIQSAVLTTTGNLSSGNACIASPGSTAGLAVGIYIYDSTTPGNVLTGTTVAGLPGSCSAGQIQMSQNAAGNGTGDTLKFGGTVSQLINDTKIYVTGLGLNKQLSAAIAAGDLAGVAGAQQVLINGGFDYWQRGVSVDIANGASTYLPDQYYGKNSLGTTGVLTLQQAGSTMSGSLYDAKVVIKTAPTASQANGAEICQVLENPMTVPLLGKQLSASCQIKALGNVNAIELRFVYATTEAKPTTALGAGATTSVNTSAFSLASLTNIAVGTTPTSSGVIGFCVRPATVSSGNIYDVGNGFLVSQCMANAGTSAATFAREATTEAARIHNVQRFFRKTYEMSTAPGTSTATGILSVAVFGSTVYSNNIITFDDPMRSSSPTCTAYNQSGSADTITLFNPAGSNGNGTASIGLVSSKSLQYTIPAGTLGSATWANFHYACEAGI